MINNNKAQIDRMNEQLNELLGPKPTEVKGTRGMFESMKIGDKLEMSYKFEEFGMMKERALVIEAYKSAKDIQLAVRAKNGLETMNVEKITSTRLKAYSYDLMSQRTTYDFKFSEMIIINKEPVAS